MSAELLQALQKRRGELAPISNNEAAEIFTKEVKRIVRIYLVRRCVKVNEESAEEAVSHTIVRCWEGRSNATTISGAVRFVQVVGWRRYLDDVKARGRVVSSIEELSVGGQGEAINQLIELERLGLHFLLAMPMRRRERAKSFLEHRLGRGDPRPSRDTLKGRREYDRIQQGISKGRHYLIEALPQAWSILEEDQQHLALWLLKLGRWELEGHQLPPNLSELVDALELEFDDPLSNALMNLSHQDRP